MGTGGILLPSWGPPRKAMHTPQKLMRQRLGPWHGSAGTSVRSGLSAFFSADCPKLDAAHTGQQRQAETTPAPGDSDSAPTRPAGPGGPVQARRLRDPGQPPHPTTSSALLFRLLDLQ